MVTPFQSFACCYRSRCSPAVKHALLVQLLELLMWSQGRLLHRIWMLWASMDGTNSGQDVATCWLWYVRRDLHAVASLVWAILPELGFTYGKA